MTVREWQRPTNVWRKVTSPARGAMRLRSVKSRNQALFANEGAGVARFRDAKDQAQCEVKP